MYQAQLSTDAKSVDGAFLGFFDKVKILAQEDYRQAAILSGMAFTFVVWAFALIFLIVAVLFYVFFLFHWIPRADGGLTGYCERKVNKALLKIVTKRVNKALAKNQARAMKAEAKAAKMTGEKFQLERAATLPDIVALGDENKLPGMPMLNRADTGQTLPPYASRPNTPGGIELSNMSRAAGVHRTGTNGSSSSFGANVPLMSAAADMGYGPASQPPNVPPGMVPPRPGTAMSQRSQAPSMAPGMARGMVPPQRPGTAMSQRSQAPSMAPSVAPGMSPGMAPGMAPPQRPGTAASQRGPAGPIPRPGTSTSQRAGMGNPYGYSNAPTPQQPGPMPPTMPPQAALAYSSTGPSAAPTIPNIGLGPTPAPGADAARTLGQPTLPHVVSAESVNQDGLGPSNSQRSMGSHSVSSIGASTLDGFENELSNRPGASSVPPHMQGMQQPPVQKLYQAYNPNARRQSPPADNPYRRQPSPEQYAAPVPPPARSATAGPTPSGPLYPVQRSLTGPGPTRAATFDNYQQQGPPQNASFAPIQRSNTGEEFQNGRWVPPSQRNANDEFDNGRWVPPSQRNAGGNATNEFDNGRWVPPSQRNNPNSYDVEAQYNERERYQY